MIITNSPDITELIIQVTWNISGSTPVINLVNLSQGNALANVSYSFVAKSPSGTFIHNADINTPDKIGLWSSTNLTDAWPRPFGQIEWSGANFLFYVTVKDSLGNIYIGDQQTAFICHPFGNTSLSKNYFGIASSNVQVKCSEARIFFQDTTYHSYKGLEGTQIGSVLKVIYPIDETATLPDPFQIAQYSTALVPISYSSNNYQFYQYNIYDYDLGNNTLVRIRYQLIQTFSVWCNVDLEPLVCEFNKLMDSIQNGTCSDVADANNKLSLISPKMTLVFIGIMQPLTGIDVPSLIEDIKTIGGFDCNCCNAATGIIPTSASVIDGYTFSVNKVCGDISGTVSNVGSNITFNLQDVSYVFSILQSSPTEISAFSVIPSKTGCQQTYALQVDGTQLATDILNIVKNNSNLVNLFNSIVNNSGSGSSQLIVDGKCVLQTTTACDYTFDILHVPAFTLYAILTSVNNIPVNFAFNQTNLPALQAYLNGLGLGIFVVTNPALGEVLLTSTANPNDLSGINYKVVNTSYIAAMTKECVGFIAKSSNEIVQAIIDYLCGITDAQIATSQDYEICYIDSVTKIKKTVTISSGAALTDFIIELLARGCDTINYITGLSAVNCGSIQALFPQSINVLQSNDWINGVKEGECAKIYPVELGARIFQLGISDSIFMSALCNAISLCGAGLPCAPFTYYYLTAAFGSPSDDTMNIVVNFAHPAAVSYTIRYARIDNTNSPVYTTITGVTTSPKVINVPDGQYNVGITPIYSDGRICSEVMQTTSACTGINSFSAVTGGSPTSEFIVSYNAVVTVPKIRVNISYPNGGSWSQIYNNTGTDIHITFPIGVYGDFAITITPVCNSTTGFFGSPTAPVILNVANPSETPATNTYSISYTNNSSAANPLILNIGNNNTSPSTSIYNGGYNSDPVTGTSANLPAVNANVVFVIGGGKHFLSVSCNGIAGPTGGASTSWGGINGNLVITFITN